MNYSFTVPALGEKAWKHQRWTDPQLGLLLRCKMRRYGYVQCAEVIEHYFPGRTEGKDDRVAEPAQSLNREPGLKNDNGQYHDGSFADWVKLHKVPPAQVEEVNSNWANWTTLKTHEGVLLELLLLTNFDFWYSPNFDESYYVGLLQKLLPNQDILPPPKLTHDTLVARVREALSRLEQCKPPLKDSAGLWKKEAIEDWKKAWKVEEGVARIVGNTTMTV